MDENEFIDGKMLSIIIPHFNSAGLLNKLLKSIPRLGEIEIIVIDDNSDDEQYDRLKDKEEFSNIIFLRNERGPKGAGTCRNIGLSTATGKWVLFADSDDYFLNDFYYIVKKYFASDFDAVFFSPTSEDLNTGGKSNRHERYEQFISDVLNFNNENTDLALRYKFVVPWSKMIRRKLIIDNNIKFDEIIVSNDTMFSIKVGHSIRKYMVSKEIIYCVTKGKGTLSRTANERIFYVKLDTFINRSIFLKEHLGEEKYDSLSLYGARMLVDCIMVYKLGILDVIKTCRRLRQNKIRIWNHLWLNPLKLYDQVIRKIKYEKQEKKYYEQFTQNKE